MPNRGDRQLGVTIGYVVPITILQQEALMKHTEIEVKCRLTPEAIANLFDDLGKSFREGKLVLQQASSFVTLTPCGEVDVEMTASAKKGKFKFEIQLKWRENEPSEEENTPAFVVSCEEPCLEEEEKTEHQQESPEQDEILYRKW